MLDSLRVRRVGYPAAVLLVLATIGILRLFPGLADSSVALLLLLSVCVLVANLIMDCVYVLLDPRVRTA